MSTTEAKVVLSVVDRITAPLAGIKARIDRLTAPVRAVGRAMADIGRAAGVDRLTSSVANLGRRLGDVGTAARQVFAPMAAVGGLAAAFGARSLVKTNMDFEKYGSVLETVLKSSTKAKAAMAWVSDFAAKTPYEIGEVTGSFVKLTTYGIDPMKGSLMAAGNAAAAMGKPINMAVEALADAMTGENERLKEFGITTEKIGGKIKYNWVENGKQMTAFAKKNSRAQIEAVITGIWNAQYGGAMDKLSSTMGGMWNNLTDQWARFMLKIGNAGSFDYMKGRLAALLDYVNGLADSGRLDAIAKDISDGIVGALKAVEEAFRGGDWAKTWEGLKTGVGIAQSVGKAFMWFADLVGGPLQGTMLVLGAITFAPLISAIASLTPVLWGLGVALLTTPIGWFIGGVALIAGAAALIIAKWEPIKAFFADLWARLPEGLREAIPGIVKLNDHFFEMGGKLMQNLWDGIRSGLDRVKAFLSAALGELTGWMPDWMKDKLGLNVTASGVASEGKGDKSAWAPPAMAVPTVAPPAPRSFAPAAPSAVANDRVAGAFGPAASVPPITAQAPDVNVSAPMSMALDLDWQNADAIMSQVRAALQNYQAQSEARIRSAIAGALSD